MQRIVLSILGLAQFLTLQSAFATPTQMQSPSLNQVSQTSSPQSQSDESKSEKLQLAYKNAGENRNDELFLLEQARLADALRAPSIAEIQQGALLRPGAQGPAVQEVKTLLKRLGYPVQENTLYELETRYFVGDFQEKNQLLQRQSLHWGVIGPETLNKLKKEAEKGRYSARIGKALVEYSRARVIGTERYCYRFVADAIHAVTAPFLEGYHAYMASDYLAKSPYFHEVFPNVKELEKLPAGAIVVWGKGHSRSGHISIADGRGNEISDHIRPQMLSHYGGAGFRVFLPIEPQNS